MGADLQCRKLLANGENQPVLQWQHTAEVKCELAGWKAALTSASANAVTFTLPPLCQLRPHGAFSESTRCCNYPMESNSRLLAHSKHPLPVVRKENNSDV